MKFSENLKAIRSSRRMTQKQLAKRLGVRRQSIVDWENPDGKRPDFLNLIGLVTVLEVSWAELMDGEVQAVKEQNPNWQWCEGLVAGLRVFGNAVSAMNTEVFNQQRKEETNEHN